MHDWKRIFLVPVHFKPQMKVPHVGMRRTSHELARFQAGKEIRVVYFLFLRGNGTAAVLCEAAAYYKNRGMTLWDRMVELWQEYGYYKEKVQTMKFDGREGAAKIQSMIQTLRDNPVQKVGTYSVEKIYDYKLGTETDAATGKSEAAVLPKSNMIYYQLADGAWFLVRPSGTEPKIKFYLGVKGNSQEDAAEQLDGLAVNVKAMFS